MFEFIAGKLASASPHKAVLDVGGVGYRVVISLSTFSKLPKEGESLAFFLSFVVREDAHTLYGFLTEQERDFFEKLTQISGVGPKTGLALLGHLELKDLEQAFYEGNTSLLSKVPGIGKKTAERLVIEMRDKVKKLSLTPASFPSQESAGVVGDAISALIHLGYNPLEAQKAVRKAAEGAKEEPNLSFLITASLRVL